ncbi:lipopolysaccharide biosynthesis protein [Thalassobacillus hwangdonensis]|uniref:Lipopolysaccharide biosynthesis protein n=1 Tax=Thalassobacillus hwangdonensis TaxID=546108 RepID=A0ABW3L438_9BACI
MEKVLKAAAPISLKMNSVWNVAGSLLYTLTQWGLLVVLAKLGSAEMVGIFTLGLALTAPVMMLMRFNLRVAVASDSREDFKFQEYYTSRVVTTAVFLVVMTAIAFFYSENSVMFGVILLLSVARGVESIGDILHGYLQKIGRLDLVAKSVMLKGAGSLIIFTGLMVVFEDLLLATAGMMISWLLVLFFYDYKLTGQYTSFRFSFDRSTQKLIFRLSFPLGVALLVDSLVSNVPRYIIEHSYGVEALGFFAAIVYIIHAGGNVIYAISNAVMPQLSNDYQEFKFRNFLKLLGSLLLMIATGGAVASLLVGQFGGEILTVVYSAEYAGLEHLFLLLMVGGVVKYMGKMVETGLFATREFHIQPYINVVTLVLIGGLSLWLIPRYGLVGAAYALMIAEGVQLVVRCGWLVFYLKKQNRKLRIV